MYLLAAELGGALSLPNGFATFWPPSGLLLAVLMRSDRRTWRWLVLATCPANLAFDVLHGRHVGSSLWYWTGNALEAIAGAWMLRRVAGPAFTLARVRHVVAFVGLAALGSTMIGATVGAAATLASQGSASFGPLWKLRWMADVIGVLVIAPVVLAWTEPAPEGLSKRGRVEWLAFIAVAAVTPALVLGRRYVPWVSPRLLLLVVVPVLGWAAWRLGPRGTAIALLAITTLAIKNHLDGVGVLSIAGDVTHNSILMIQAVLSGIVVTFLLIAAGVAESDELEHALRRANRMKLEFVSTMSHELRTPLAAIMGYVEMGRDARFETADRLAFLHDIDRSARQLLELIEATLDVGRLEAGRDEARLEPISLLAFWDDLRTGCANIPRHDDVELSWGNSVPDRVLVTDRRKLTIVLRNLITNALKFTERGSVRVDAEIDLSSVIFRVRDTGVGIDPDDHDRIFEMYRQADSSDTRRYGGTGLGLHIVRRFLDQLGGTIALESTLGQGSTFTITLPDAVA